MELRAMAHPDPPDDWRFPMKNDKRYVIILERSWPAIAPASGAGPPGGIFRV
jgi:hypothetical protein